MWIVEVLVVRAGGTSLGIDPTFRNIRCCRSCTWRRCRPPDTPAHANNASGRRPAMRCTSCCPPTPCPKSGRCRIEKQDSAQKTTGRGAGRRAASRVRQQLPLQVRHGNHQVGSVLADIADLDRRRVGKLVLDGQVPLVGKRRLHVRIPYPDERSGKWIARRAHRRQALVGSCCREVPRLCIAPGFQLSGRAG